MATGCRISIKFPRSVSLAVFDLLGNNWGKLHEEKTITGESGPQIHAMTFQRPWLLPQLEWHRDVGGVCIDVPLIGSLSYASFCSEPRMVLAHRRPMCGPRTLAACQDSPSLLSPLWSDTPPPSFSEPSQYRYHGRFKVGINLDTAVSSVPASTWSRC